MGLKSKIDGKIILLVIIVAAAILRFWKLGSYPMSLSWDEAAIGYNAYSISKYGIDEYGKKFPLLFKSFNDYKLPGYIYTDAVAVKFLGLSEFSTRLPSAIFGTLSVILIYFLTKNLLSNWKLKIAIISAALFAISPWALQFSRAAFEANSALTIVLLGATLLTYGLKNKIFAILSIPVLALSIYFYYSSRIFVPLFLICFALIYKKEFTAKMKYYILGFIIALLISTPMIVQILSPAGAKRVSEVSIFADRSLISDYVDAKTKYTGPVSAIFLNRRIPVAWEAMHNYSSHFSPGFLFFGDDPNPRQRPGNHGLLYIIELPLIIAGLWSLAKSKDPKPKLTIFAWLLIAPMSAAFANQTPHGLRSLLMLPAVIVISAIGIAQFSKTAKLAAILSAIFAILFINYLYNYYIIYPLKNSTNWAYGYKEAFSRTAKLESNYDRIVFTGFYWKPYIFYLFYNKIDTAFYQSTGSQEQIAKYNFGTTQWDSGGKNLSEDDIIKQQGTKTLLVISPAEYRDLKDKYRFNIQDKISDYSGKTDLFLIGNWQ